MEFNGTSIMALRPKSADASDLTTWLEMGAFDAIKRKYLERLVLVIFEGDPNGADATILEEHSFSVTYPECGNGEHQLELVSRDHAHGTKTKQKDVPGSKSAVKKECVSADPNDSYLRLATQQRLRLLPRGFRERRGCRDNTMILRTIYEDMLSHACFELFA